MVFCQEPISLIETFSHDASRQPASTSALRESRFRSAAARLWTVWSAAELPLWFSLFRPRMSFIGFFSGILSFPRPFPLTCRVARGTVPVEQVVPEVGKRVNVVPVTVFCA